MVDILRLEKGNGNTYWRDAIREEMSNIRVAFDILDALRNVEPGRIYLDCYMCFEVKMDFRRKARYVANGSKIPDLNSTTYAGVVSRESVQIALTFTA